MRSVACGVSKIVHKKYYNCYSNNIYHDGLVSHLLLHTSYLEVSHFSFARHKTLQICVAGGVACTFSLTVLSTVSCVLIGGVACALCMCVKVNVYMALDFQMIMLHNIAYEWCFPILLHTYKHCITESKCKCVSIFRLTIVV